jgi:hypothetical protein
MQLGACKLHLSGCNEDLSILGCAQVVHHTHQLTRLRLGFLGLRNMQVHLITIKVSVVGTADALIEAESPAANNVVLRTPGKDCTTMQQLLQPKWLSLKRAKQQ